MLAFLYLKYGIIKSNKKGHLAVKTTESWQIGITLRLPSRLPAGQEPHEYKPLRTLVREFMREHQVEVAYIGVYSPLPNPHIHLAIAYRNQGGLTPRIDDFSKWENRWNELVRYKNGGLVAENVWDSDGWFSYVEKHFHYPDTIAFYRNNEMLEQLGLGG